MTMFEMTAALPHILVYICCVRNMGLICCDNAIELRKGRSITTLNSSIDNEIPERKYESNKLLIRTHKAA